MLMIKDSIAAGSRRARWLAPREAARPERGLRCKERKK